jgi:IclR helix-turn-helix domain
MRRVTSNARACLPASGKLPQDEISIRLSRDQVNEVVRRAASCDGLLAGLGAGLTEGDVRGFKTKMDDARFSRSLLRALMVLASYPADGSTRSVSDVAKQLGMGISTAHRYTSTFAEVGVLERDPVSRQYRLATSGMSAAGTS